MESILWNKVLLELQQELKEIPDGSVQELLQKLLCAEITIQERELRKQVAITISKNQALQILYLV